MCVGIRPNICARSRAQKADIPMRCNALEQASGDFRLARLCRKAAYTVLTIYHQRSMCGFGRVGSERASPLRCPCLLAGKSPVPTRSLQGGPSCLRRHLHLHLRTWRSDDISPEPYVPPHSKGHWSYANGKNGARPARPQNASTSEASQPPQAPATLTPQTQTSRRVSPTAGNPIPSQQDQSAANPASSAERITPASASVSTSEGDRIRFGPEIRTIAPA